VSDGWDPIGLATSPAFRRYVEHLQRTASFGPDHGAPADNGHPDNDMATSSDSYDDTIEPTTTHPNYGLALARLPQGALEWLDTADGHGSRVPMARRTFMATAAASAATAAGLGTAAAQGGDLNFDTDMTPDPRIRGLVTVAEVGPNMAQLEYINDGGTVESLEDYGGMLAADDDDTAAYNPVTLQAGAGGIGADTFGALPRDEQYDESGDGSANTDVSVLDPTHWSTDETSTAGTISVADAESQGGVDSLRVSTSSQSSGDTAVATFDGSYVSLADNIDQREIQIGVDVDVLDSSTVVEFVLEDGSGNTVTVSIDDGLTLSDADVVADGTGPAYVYQASVGDVNPDTLNGIEKFRINVTDGNADVSLFWIDVERTEKLSLGTEEYENNDGNYETQELREPQGAYTIQELGSLDQAFSSATIYEVQYDAQFRASAAPGSWIDYQFEDAGRYDQDHKFRAVYNLDLPTAFDLSWSLDDMVVAQSHGSNRYLTVETASESEQQTLEDTADDSSTSWTSRTSRFDGQIGSQVTLTGAPSASAVEAVYYNVLVNEGERSEMEAAGETEGAGGGPTGGGGGGLLDTITSVPGMIITGIISALGLRSLGIIGGS
jgi:hypothetical protein